MHDQVLMTKEQISHVVHDVVTHYGKERSELVGILKTLTNELGHLTPQMFVEVAQWMELPVGEVYSVASFYTMLLMEPRGRHLVQFCESAPCHIAGAEELLACMVELLGTQPGKTSEDGRWTLMTTSCLGQCAEGPVVVIDDEIHSRVTRETLPEILSHYD